RPQPHQARQGSNRLTRAGRARHERRSTPPSVSSKWGYPDGLLEHSRIFLGRLPTLGRVTIIGGGFIGLEIAGLLREKGVAVDLVEMADRLMARAVSRPVSDFFLELHRRMGTEVHLHSMLASAYHGPEGVEVRLSDGRRLHSDAVLLAAGVLPNVELAAAAGLDVDNGILVDDYLRTSDPAISALGDCAQFPCVFCDGQARLESVQNAVDQARSIAKRLCGRPTPYTDLPWFWSNQGAARLQIAGLSTGHDRTVLRGDPERGKFSVFLYRGEKLIAVESVNAAAEHLAARKLLAEGLSVPCELAAQHDVDFRHLAT
uniref:NAD(P)/FAD-dependent oxidoreductase n=1 Tax=Roseomonas chloroacetimidivorans TaxID=1766656 RepID=UPI003C779F1F